MVIAHQHGLDAVAVRQLPEVFDRAVLGGDLLPGHRRNAQDTGRFQTLPQGQGQIGHLIKGANAPAQPGEHLLSPKGGLPKPLEEVPQLREGHGFDIGHGSPQTRRVMRQM